MKNVKFRGIPRKKDEFRGKISRLTAAAKTQISRLGSKFRGARKTVGPTFYVRKYVHIKERKPIKALIASSVNLV